MSVLHNNPFLLASGNPTDPTFPLNRSVRFRSSASPYFTRTPATAGNRKTWTYSGWVKRGTLGTASQWIFSSDAGSTDQNEFNLVFTSSDQLSVSGAVTTWRTSTPVYRDPSAWYHIVLAVDTTQSTANNRIRIYVNGVEVTAFATLNNPTQNDDLAINQASQHNIGIRVGNTSPFDGYLTEVNFIDGQALTPLSFGGYNPGTNVWEPRAYTGTYGTNGFYLPFKDNSKVEALGYSSSISSPELITNSTFTTNVTGWTARNGTALTWQTGSLARLSNTGSAACMAYITIPTVVGQTYYVQTHIPTVSLGAAGRNVGIYKSDDQALAVNPVFVASGTVAGAYRGTFTATATTTYITMFGDTYGTGSCDFSVVSVAEVGYKNNWKPFNVSLTSGVTYDSMLDVPTLTSGTNSNFPTLNPLQVTAASIGTISEANLAWSCGASATYGKIYGTMAIPSTGQYYWEVTAGSTGNLDIGIISATDQTTYYPGYSSVGYTYYQNTGQKVNNNVYATYGASYTTNDVIGVAFDATAGTLTFYKNNVSQGTAFTGLTGTYVATLGNQASGASTSAKINFGQRPFSYTPPSGFKSLNTYNLPEPTIPSGDDYHKVYTYTGNGGGLQVGEIQKPSSLFNLDRSLRFRASNSAYLSRAFSSSPTTFTFSCWVKRGSVTTQQVLAASRLNGAQSAYLIFNATGQIQFLLTNGTAVTSSYTSTAIFKDPSMWYNVVFSATAGGTGYVYVNGVQILSGAVPSGYWLFTNTASWVNAIGRLGDSATSYLDGYLADVYFIDGQALAPADFGAFDGNNYWTPKAYTGTYGTNGFHLEFEDYSGTTASTIGKDTSGQGNNWTPSGINLTTPEADNEYWDSYTDVPTLNDVNTANYCVFDSLQFGSTELRNGNLTYVWGVASTAYKYRGTTTLTTGKWYFEGNIEAFTIGNAGNTNYAFGFIAASGVDTHISFGWTTNGTSMKLGYRYDVAGVIVQNVTYNTTAPVSTDIFGVEYDVDNGTANFYKNGTLMGSASGLALGAVKPHVWRSGTSNSATVHANFGQRAFKYTPSTGYKKINDFNVAEVTGDLETPDFLWIKSRSAATGHALFNSVTGVGKYLSSNATTAETTDVNSLIQFNKNGFLLGNAAIVNTSAATYVASAWKAGNTTVTNTDGSITSQVKANQIDGFSIVTYTGNGSSSATVGHGLGITPKMIICKDKSAIAGWSIYHASLAASNGLTFTTAAQFTAASTTSGIISTSPTSTTFGFTSGSSNVNNVNANGNNLVAYCFAEIAGFSKFGSYTGNGSADGPFVHLGFRPRWVLLKLTSSAGGGWYIYDTSRNTYNVMDKYLRPEVTDAETTFIALDTLSNGFKIRTTNTQFNGSGSTYIYAAFAENPFKYALAR